MKHLPAAILFVLGIWYSGTTQAQTNITNDYVVISTGEVTNSQPYLDALDAANWESYRLRNNRSHLSFANGFTIELKSAIELVNSGISVNPSNYKLENSQGYSSPILVLMPGNIIGIETQTPSVKMKNN